MSDPNINSRKTNREQFPDIAEFVDELRAVFGDVRVTSLTPYSSTEN